MPFVGHTKSLDLFARASGSVNSRCYEPKDDQPNEHASTALVLESPPSPVETSDGEYSDDGQDAVRYCEHYLLTGNCAYTQQGCRSSHKVPRLDDLRLWRKLGFIDPPNWLRQRSDQAQAQSTQPRRLTKKGNILPEPGTKYYCSFFLQTGYCGYAHIGCKFSHEVPDQHDLELWQAIGFRKVPNWLCSRLSEDQIQDTQSPRLTKKGNPLPPLKTKKYCDYFLRTGRCRFARTGCVYSHEVPDLNDHELWQAIGFNGVPFWLREANGVSRSVQHEPARPPATEKSQPENFLSFGCDNEGNEPSPTLWVGNVPSTLEESRLKEKFGHYGVIESVRVVPEKRCAFVNFLEVSSAVKAWDELHNEPVFHEGRRICLRYQRLAQSSAVQNTIPMKSRSVSLREPLRDGRQNENLASMRSEQTMADDDHWPGRPPPCGPKSQGMDISPPPLRRDGRQMDSYAPRQQGLRDEVINSATRSSDRDCLKPTNHCGHSSDNDPDRTPSGTPRQGNSANPNTLTNRVDSELGQREELSMPEPGGISYKQNLDSIVMAPGSAAELLYIEEKEPRPYIIGVYLNGWGYKLQRLGTGISFCSKSSAEQEAAQRALKHPLLEKVKSEKATYLGEKSKEQKQAADDEDQITGNVNMHEQNEYGPGTRSYEQDREPKPRSVSSDATGVGPGISARGGASETLYTSKPLSVPAESGNKVLEATEFVEVTKARTPEAAASPKTAGFDFLAALYPTEEDVHAAAQQKTRILSSYDSKRASYTPLSDHTSSSRSSSLRKKCSYCKKPESNFQSLISCTTCPRRFHNICGDPRPDKVAKGSFVCGRCLERQKPRPADTVIESSMTAATTDAGHDASAPAEDLHTIHSALPPRPQFDNLPLQESILIHLADTWRAESGSSEFEARTKVDTSDVTIVHRHAVANGQMGSAEPTERTDTISVRPTSTETPLKDCAPGYGCGSHQLDEASARASTAHNDGANRMPGLSHPEMTVSSAESAQGPNKSGATSLARKAMKDRLVDIYDGSHEDGQVQTPLDDDENIPQPPRAPKAMRHPVPSTYGNSCGKEDCDQTLSNDERENLPVNILRRHGSLGSLKPHLIYNPLVFAGAQKVAMQYKRVTCPWWQAGNTCKRHEDECMFSHRHTGIESPNGNNRAKHWTCPQWHAEQTRPEWHAEQHCLQTADNCLYAHADTGYYVGRDGKARKKHLTCYWFYNKGRCNRPSEECLFAHCWTGLLAEEPASKPARSSIARHEDRQSWKSASFSFARPPPPISTTQEDSDSDYEPTLVKSPVQTTPLPPTELLQDFSTGVIKNAVSLPKEASDVLPQSPSRDTRDKLQASTDPRPRGVPETPMHPPPLAEANGIFGSTKKSPSASTTTTSTATTTESDEAQRKTSIGSSVKECKLCGKKVIGRDVCMACQQPDKESDIGHPSNGAIENTNSREVQPGSPGSAEIDVGMTDVMESTEPNGLSTEPQTTNKVLKRAASGSGMFGRNKRSRLNHSSVLCKQSRPKVVPPSIEEVIAAERAKRAQHDMPKVSNDVIPLIRSRSPTVPAIASPEHNSTQPLLSSLAPSAGSTTVSEIASAAAEPPEPEDLEQPVPSCLNDSCDKPESSTTQAPQASSATRQMNDVSDALEGTEHSLTESTLQGLRPDSTFTKPSDSVSSDEGSYMPLALASEQVQKERRKTNEQDKLWSSSTISSQNTYDGQLQDDTTAQSITIPAPNRLASGRYNCPFACGKTFAHAKGAERHAADLHVNVINYTCDICGKGYYRKDKYQAHTKSHAIEDVTLSRESANRRDRSVSDSGLHDTLPSRGSRAISQAITGLNPLHEATETEGDSSASARILEPAISVESETESEDEDAIDGATTDTPTLSELNRIPVKIEETAYNKIIAFSSATAQTIDSDEDETDSDSSDDQSEQACEVCKRHETDDKCLHGVHGELDGKKCDDYISERIARNIHRFSGKTRHQLRMVEDMALGFRRKWQALQTIKPTNRSAKDGVVVMPEVLTFHSPEPAMSMDFDTLLEIRNHCLGRILFKAQIQSGPCAQDWEIKPNWGEIEASHMLNVCVRRKLNSLPMRQRKTKPLPFQYPESVIVSYVQINTSDKNANGVRVWELSEETGTGWMKKIGVPVANIEDAPLPEQSEKDSRTSGAAKLDEVDNHGDDRDELTLSDVEKPRPAKKVQGKPIVLVPPTKLANNSQALQARKLTLKLSAKSQPEGGSSMKEQLEEQNAAADGTALDLLRKTGKSQDKEHTRKNLATIHQATQVKKINLRVRSPPSQSPDKTASRTKAQHRRTVDEASRSEESPLKRLRVAASSVVADGPEAAHQLNIDNSAHNKGAMQSEPSATPRTRPRHTRTLSGTSKKSTESLQERSRRLATLDVTDEELDEALHQNIAEKRPEPTPRHERDVSNATTRDDKSPLKGWLRTNLETTKGGFEASHPPNAKTSNALKRQEPSAKLLASIARLKARGVKFEDSSTDDEDGEEESNRQPTKPRPTSAAGITYPPREPLEAFLFTRDKHSLYYKPENDLLPPPPDAKLRLPKITKGEGMKHPHLIRRRQMLRNLWLYGNAHRECDRRRPKQEVTALVERKVADPEDRWAPEVLQVREETITFREFCGLKKDAEYEPCLMGSGEGARLAYREKEDGNAKVGAVGAGGGGGGGGGGGAGIGGRRKRVADGEKWPVSER